MFGLLTDTFVTVSFLLSLWESCQLHLASRVNIFIVVAVIRNSSNVEALSHLYHSFQNLYFMNRIYALFLMSFNNH